MRLALIAASLAVLMNCGGPGPPPPPKTDIRMVEESLHGVSVQDPYRWLEDSATAESKAWIADQVSYSRAFLDTIPEREGIRARMTEILSSGVISTPTSAGGRYFYAKKSGSQNQPIVYMRGGLDGDDRIPFGATSARKQQSATSAPSLRRNRVTLNAERHAVQTHRGPPST